MMRAHWLVGREQDGRVWRDEEAPRPDYEIGNIAFFSSSKAPVDWQIRPALLTDGACGADQDPRQMLLVRRWLHGKTLYITVSLPPHRRRNTPANVAFALKKVFRSRPETEAIVTLFDKLPNTEKPDESSAST